ncbi:unnamed protein product [Cuscuta epithymum]|uniref:Nuclear transcription factor Y subunit n=1 Tax=Cuscuta epithymum TaxID=186058 RepID=A0AAV0DVE7_9ASTE|nr:unnamed protein product [Cuscuta epithymum]CAH9122033.1 unnamed protein product [Cuscuta epithymum]
MKHLSLQLQGQNSPPAQSSLFLSQLEVTATRTASQDQSCVSSGSESHGKQLAARIKPMFFIGNPDYSVSPSQCEMSHSTIHSQYNYTDPYYSGLFTAYGPQPFPQMVGVAPARIPLPIDVAADDGPIYVNAKQYHGILRRRQIRAKLEAQNKIVKNRRPYLHESRHLHAVKRVRGSGGRFLGTKKLVLQDSSSPATDAILQQHSASSPHILRPQAAAAAVFQQPDHRLLGISSHMQGGTREYYSPIVL